MEDVLSSAFQSGNAIGIVGSLVVYLIIYIQRKNTSTSRDNATAELQKEINELKKENELKQKDIDHLMSENEGIKQDIKEIKATLQQISLSLERIATKYEKLN